MLTPADDRRRWWGSFFLGGAASLLICGQTVLKPYLEELGYVLYWLACIAFTWLAIFTALLDFWALRRRSRQERIDLMKRTLAQIEADRAARTGDPDEAPEAKPPPGAKPGETGQADQRSRQNPRSAGIQKIQD